MVNSRNCCCFCCCWRPVAASETVPPTCDELPSPSLCFWQRDVCPWRPVDAVRVGRRFSFAPGPCTLLRAAFHPPEPLHVLIHVAHGSRLTSRDSPRRTQVVLLRCATPCPAVSRVVWQTTTPSKRLERGNTKDQRMHRTRGPWPNQFKWPSFGRKTVLLTSSLA